MAVTYETVGTATLTSASASVTFSSIPQTYTDLIVVGKLVEDTGGNNNCEMRFNSDSLNNYSIVYMYGDGTGYNSSSQTNRTGIGLSYGNANAGRVPYFIVHINSYTNTNVYKTVLNRNHCSNVWTAMFGQMWRNTSAISTISFHTTNTNLGVGTTFTIYGIKEA